jgi:3-deoxy-D-manno-octulosonate 8-phosphate phosphatase (KDO 8-P phosphatase)
MPAAPIVPDDLRTKLLRIRALVLDVDGVLTDGTLTFDEEGRELKSFDVKDGLGLVLLRDLGYRIGIISSRVSKVVAQRCRDLKIPDECILQGELDKAAAFDRLVGRWGFESYEAVAVGDDLPDLGMMRRAGIGACPSDAVSIVKDAAALHLTKPGGGGAVRELCDLILEIRRGARADKPQEVRPAQPSSDGSVVQFPGSRT